MTETAEHEDHDARIAEVERRLDEVEREAREFREQLADLIRRAQGHGRAS